jgi:hypothetical protein
VDEDAKVLLKSQALEEGEEEPEPKAPEDMTDEEKGIAEAVSRKLYHLMI